MHWHHLVMYHPQVYPICHWATVKSVKLTHSTKQCVQHKCPFLGSEWNYHSARGKNVSGFSTHLDGNLHWICPNYSFGTAKQCNIYSKTIQFWMFFIFFARVFVCLGRFSTNLSLSQVESRLLTTPKDFRSLKTSSRLQSNAQRRRNPFEHQKSKQNGSI